MTTTHPQRHSPPAVAVVVTTMASSVPAATAAAGGAVAAREVAAASEAKEGGGTEWGTLPYTQRALVRIARAPRGMVGGSSTRLPKCHTEVAVMAATATAAVGSARERAAASPAASRAAVAARGRPGSCSRCSPSRSRKVGRRSISNGPKFRHS